MWQRDSLILIARTPHAHLYHSIKWSQEGRQGMTIQSVIRVKISVTDCPLLWVRRSPTRPTGRTFLCLRGNKYVYWLFCLRPNLVCDPNSPDGSITGSIIQSRLRFWVLWTEAWTLSSTRESRTKTARYESDQIFEDITVCLSKLVSINWGWEEDLQLN